MIKKIKNFYNAGIGIHFDDFCFIIYKYEIDEILNKKHSQDNFFVNHYISIDFLELQKENLSLRLKTKKEIRIALIEAKKEYPEYFI